MTQKQGKKISFLGILFYPIRLLIKTTIWLVVILIVLAFIAPAFIPVEKIIPIPTINDVVMKNTGLKVELSGKTRLSILPFLGITAHNVQLTNEQFPIKNVLNAKKIDIKISVFPILAGKVIVKNVNIDSANINIMQCNNKFNFFSPIGGIQTEAPKINKPVERESSMLYIRDISLTNFSISNSSVSYSECNSKVAYNIDKFNATISVPNFQSPVNAQISFLLNDQNFDITFKSSNINDIINNKKGEAHITVNSDIAKINASTQYKINTNNPTFVEKASATLKITDVSIKNVMKYLSMEWQGFDTSLPNINMETALEIDSNNIKIANTEIAMGDISIATKGFDVTIGKSFSPLTLSTAGLVTITAKNIQNLLTTLNISIPDMAKYPSLISAPLYFTFEKGILKINEGSKVTVDNTTVNFYAIIDAFSTKKAITAKMDSKFVNIDEYIKFEDAKSTEANNTNGEAKSSNMLEGLPKEPITLLDTHTIAIDFQADIQKLIVNGIAAENIYSNTKARNGTISNTTTLNVFSGKTKLELQAQETDAILHSISINVDIQDLATHDAISTLKLPPVMHGIVNANVSFTAGESSPYHIIAKGNGKANVNATDLMVKGLDVDTMVADLKTDYKKLLAGGGFAKYLSTTKKSTVEQILIQATLSHGIVKNTKLFAKKDKIILDGIGEINLTNSQLKYYIKLLNDNEPLPSVVLNGTLDNISYSLDPKAFIIHQAKKNIGKAIERPEVQEKLEKFNNLIGSFKK
jgi:uncharacterized protein involved in outer membrane biogenesis